LPRCGAISLSVGEAVSASRQPERAYDASDSGRVSPTGKREKEGMTVLALEQTRSHSDALDLIEDYSLEITAKDAESLEEAASRTPQGTRISIAFLSNEDFAARVRAAVALRRLGFVPVPHISARRLKSRRELEDFLDALTGEAEVEDVFIVAGDPPHPEGPYEDALAVIRSGLLKRYGVKHVGIAGYPEGHPDIGTDRLWQAMRHKQAELRTQSLDFSIMTQFAFDAEAVLGWLEQLRREGVYAPVRLGIAGPASVRTLLRFATRCGVGASAKVMTKYGLSLTKLLTTAGPDPIIEDLAARLNSDVHGEVLLHFYPFGGLLKSVQWIHNFKQEKSKS
jgi:methylenetetrahydrofolate reductase (NADPH)